MGCSSPQNATLGLNISPQNLNRILQLADLNHPLNVNKKYEHLARLNPSMSVGFGFKKTCAYECPTTKEELESKRKEFWETRVNGQPEYWIAIRKAIENPDRLVIVRDAHLTMLNNSIQLCLDNRPNRYEVPVFCINEPINYSSETLAEKFLNFEYDDVEFQIKIRSVKYPNGDIVIKDKASTDIRTIKETMRVIKGLEKETIRFFYNGREMLDSHTLGNYKYFEGAVIQAMIR